MRTKELEDESENKSGRKRGSLKTRKLENEEA